MSSLPRIDETAEPFSGSARVIPARSMSRLKLSAPPVWLTPEANRAHLTAKSPGLTLVSAASRPYAPETKWSKMSDQDTVGSSDDEPHGRPPGPPPLRSSGRCWIVSVFGDITRSGSWPPGRTTSPVALFGDIDLDFRQATMPPGEVVINAVAPFGNIDVLVPEGALVDVGGFTLFGSKKVAVGEASPNESAAVVRVRGFTLFGSLKVWSS